MYSEIRGEGGGRERGLREATAAADFFPPRYEERRKGWWCGSKIFFA